MFYVRDSRFLSVCLAAVLAALLSSAPVHAASNGEAPSELDAAFDAARKVAQSGPAEVTLGQQAKLKLPENFVYVPPKEGSQLMRAMGNRTSEGFLGLVFPTGSRADEGWFVVIRFDDAGYIKDDDAKDWDADELLQSLKEGTEQTNEERVARGITPIEVVGWVEKPHYDATTHQLVWSVSSKDKGQPSDAEQGINYNTYTLGRHGYVSMNLVTDLNLIGEYKKAAGTLLAGLSFNDGNRYADFDASTDKVAAYGLAALVGGVAAKKLGLFAALAVFFAKFWKLIAIGIFAGGGIFAKIFKRNKAANTAP